MSMNGEEQLKSFSDTAFEKTITKINDRIYHFLGYGHSNVTMIIGDTSVILIDSLDSDKRAQRLKEEIATLTDKPVKTIIFTHGHPDHRGGSQAFQDTVEEVMAFSPVKMPLPQYERLNDILEKRGSFQFGYELSNEEAISQGIGIREGRAVDDGKYAFIKPTTLYHDQVIERDIDGIHFKMVRALGETDDQIYIWLEEDQVMISGDNYYGCWPNLYAIRGTQYRDIATWIQTLEEVLSYPSCALLPGHTKALIGYEHIQDIVGNFKNALKSIFDQTLDCMNQGMTLDQTVQSVYLPEQYKNLEYLKEYYGMIEWSVKSIYTGYLGWFDGDATHLLPVSQQEWNHVLLDLIGSKDKIMEYIEECKKQENYQVILQLIEILESDGQNYTQLKKEVLTLRAKQMISANARHYYLCSAKHL